eukprot:13603828-Ditylum_brightwellii.AAC.1
MRIYFQNINGIATEEDLKSYMEDMAEKEIDIWGWAKTNVNWTPNMTSRAKYYGNKIFTNFTLVGSSSDNPAWLYQQGGTCTAITRKMIGRIIKSDTDSSGLGRWSYVQIAGQDQRKLTTITAYRPCKQNKLDDGTVTSQQKRLLRQQGIDQPKPRTAWTKDLCPILQKW